MVVGFATDPASQFADTTETEVTVPVAEEPVSTHALVPVSHTKIWSTPEEMFTTANQPTCPVG